jgi:hypothetical protein
LKSLGIQELADDVQTKPSKETNVNNSGRTKDIHTSTKFVAIPPPHPFSGAGEKRQEIAENRYFLGIHRGIY